MQLCAELNMVDGIGHIARVTGAVRARTSPKGHLCMSAPGGGKGKREGSAVP